MIIIIIIIGLHPRSLSKDLWDLASLDLEWLAKNPDMDTPLGEVPRTPPGWGV